MLHNTMWVEAGTGLLAGMQVSDYPPESTGLLRRPSRVVGDAAVLVVVPPPYSQKNKKKTVADGAVSRSSQSEII